MSLPSSAPLVANNFVNSQTKFSTFRRYHHHHRKKPDSLAKFVSLSEAFHFVLALTSALVDRWCGGPEKRSRVTWRALWS